MDVRDLVDDGFRTVDADETVGTLRGVFEDPTLKSVAVTNSEEFLGMVTRRDLLSSQERPERKAKTIVRAVPRISPETEVRETARLMLTADTPTLPVMKDGALQGCVSADALLERHQESFNAIEASDLVSDDLVTVTADATLGKVLALFRNHRIRHIPVVEEDGKEIVGIISLHDVFPFVSRMVDRAQGGRPDAELGAPVGAHHGGFGERKGERMELLSIPARDLMARPVLTVAPDRPADEILAEMNDFETSSVVVSGPNNGTGIVTTTDMLEALTWSDDTPYYIHVFGADRMDELSWGELSDRIESIVRKNRRLRPLEAKVHFHHHKEKLRGRPLVLARVRVFTDNGHFIGSGEGFGDKQAFGAALDVIERQLLDEKGPRRADRARRRDSVP